MTTSGSPRKPAPRHAAQADTSNAQQPPGPTAADKKPETAPQPDAAPAAGEDAEQLRQDIERTREQLGETVEELAAKADVKSRAGAKAAKLSGRVKAKASQAQTKAATRAGDVRGQFAGKSATVQRWVAAVGAPVWEATPEPVRQAVTKGASTARQRRMPLAAAAALVIAGYLVIRRWRRR